MGELGNDVSVHKISKADKMELMEYMLGNYITFDYSAWHTVGMCTLADWWCNNNGHYKLDVIRWISSLDPINCREHLGHWIKHDQWCGGTYWFSTKHGPAVRISFIKEVIELIKSDKI